MPVITTRVDVATYAKLAKAQKDAGLPDISTLFLQRCGILTDHQHALQIVLTALSRAENKENAESFRIRDLFDECEWKQLARGTRLRAGRLFAKSVNTAQGDIRFHYRSNERHIYYVKIK